MKNYAIEKMKTHRRSRLLRRWVKHNFYWIGLVAIGLICAGLFFLF